MGYCAKKLLSVLINWSCIRFYITVLSGHLLEIHFSNLPQYQISMTELKALRWSLKASTAVLLPAIPKRFWEPRCNLLYQNQLGGPYKWICQASYLQLYNVSKVFFKWSCMSFSHSRKYNHITPVPQALNWHSVQKWKWIQDSSTVL